MSNDVSDEVAEFLEGAPERIEIAKLAVRLRGISVSLGKLIVAHKSGNDADFNAAFQNWIAADQKLMNFIKDYIGEDVDD